MLMPARGVIDTPAPGRSEDAPYRRAGARTRKHGSDALHGLRTEQNGSRVSPMSLIVFSVSWSLTMLDSLASHGLSLLQGHSYMGRTARGFCPSLNCSGVKQGFFLSIIPLNLIFGLVPAVRTPISNRTQCESARATLPYRLRNSWASIFPQAATKSRHLNSLYDR